MNLMPIRRQFPALMQEISGVAPVFLDGPGGSQVPQSVLSAMSAYLGYFNSNLGGAFFSSDKTVELMSRARQSVAQLLNAPSSEQIVFGANMTSLTFSFSRAISRQWQAEDEVIVTNADHYSNVSSWRQAAEDKGAKVHALRINESDCTLDLEHYASLLNSNTKLVAVTYASNTTGSINDIKKIIAMAHEVGALVYVDAVHFAPHELIDVQALDCDFLACSAYKFFGPHVGIVYGKREHLEGFTPYKVEPAKDVIPGRWETGTQSFEGLAGVIAAIEYIASLSDLPESKPLRARLEQAFANSKAHEMALSQHFLTRLGEFPQIKLFGIDDLSRLTERTPTFALTFEGIEPRKVSEFLGKHHVCVWDGNFYAQGLCEQLGVMDKGGVVRIGCMHYNTIEELDRLFELFSELLN
ncbi:cysteine desulfurase-like protein [Pseudoalteromonas luteoviolacea]|uniref:Cysteine desulfurase n=1 Tax=Pseudoalteromonas luteoviolacea S4054 TaxID=1129367 RepID=A0A0F6A4W0_9GAMM|nr:cysteine desulfurase-like protein [Pseudoalteromonas luteoviolacea]AOT06557.1 cysteine desulfurase-like protein [Pseudoalteromonas luteoviolacea]AOT11474.1 cysteine desulfurase-like protein [Pseudoalteromonas luteoviolacea]AOT16387.1 cysteine desulfurase-like protein [Pseudoalteromonas luteoviolacea]KKE81123.1 cysteine desulfurase [Pseudoalteromonas luteoviolacea S4054]KZN62469.1 cysteine desulfurase [Pseudoalteromonas luteoviolacea S4047-1]